MKTREMAEKVWKELYTGSVGTETGISIIEKHLKEAAKAEREEIINDITSHHWSYSYIPVWIWTLMIWKLTFCPKKFFATYFKLIQTALALKVKNRV